MKRLLLTLFLCTALNGISAQATVLAGDFVVTKLIAGDLFTYDDQRLQQTMALLEMNGFNTITTTIAWSVVEPREGQFDFSAYQHVLDRLTAGGFKLILILDSSMRELLDQHIRSTDRIAVPGWLIERFPNATASDFGGERSYNLDYADSDHRPPLARFYRRTLDWLHARYGDTVIAVAPGIMQELEIKYAQWGYRWQSYTDAAQQGFNDWLARHDKAPASLPVIDYNNNLGAHRPREEPLFEPFMRYREAAIENYVCELTGLIRESGYTAAGYFGQSLTSHDGIYALGVIEELTDCFDKVTVDYNYFDGWQVELDPYIIPMLVNYAYNLGYDQVMGGLYLEKYYAPDGRFLAEHLQTARRTIELLADESPDGIEIGNVHFGQLARLDALNLDSVPQPDATPSSTARHRIGIVASKWTFYLWHGEHSFNRNLIQDALVATYRLLREAPDIDVEILGEQALFTQDLSRYDALILPHQTTLSAPALKAIRRYYDRGGHLVQDVQFNAFAPDGEPNPGWSNELFGIGGISAHQAADKFIVDHRRLVLPKQPHSYFSHFLLAPRPGYRLLMRRFDDPDTGLMVRGERTLVFGFLPQLVEDPAKGDYWQRLYVDAIRDLISGSP